VFWRDVRFRCAGEANLTRSFSGTDLAGALAAVGKGPRPLRTSSAIPCWSTGRQNMVQHAGDADAGSRPSTAQAGLLKDMMQLDGMADDLRRSVSADRILPKCVN
jgi:hypothetical protein